VQGLSIVKKTAVYEESNLSMNTVQINDVSDFSPDHTFECGQAFRWNRDSKGYVGIVKDKVIRVIFHPAEKRLTLENCSMEEYNSFWKHYFDLDRDYGRIKKELSLDPVLKEAIGYGWGMRILNQDPWETLISFIISANNNIRRIKGIIEKLSMKYGREIPWNGNVYYTFPSPEALSRAEDEDLKACGCGYRGRYIKETAGMVRDGLIEPEGLKELSYEEAHKTLLGCMGVGDKVADCILLFSMEKTQAFPVDVWVKRVMEHYYFHRSVPIRQIKSLAAEKFGRHAGLAQQYLFYYAREQNLGK
jgi:N-glycosylase/DNA lyase